MKSLIVATVLLLAITTNVSAKQIDIPGLYVSTSTTVSKDGTEVTVTVTCALISTDKCYSVTSPGKSMIDPTVVNGELNPEDQYTQINLPDGIVFKGNVISHYQYNTLSETGRILRVHRLELIP